MKITDIFDRSYETDCLSCDIWEKKIEPPFGIIAESKHFFANQDFEFPIPGFIIVCAKRHVHHLFDLSDEELGDFIRFLAKVRKLMRDVLKIEQVKIVQSESSRHHFHFWLFPITPMSKEMFGTGISSVRPALDYSKEKLNTPENIKKVEENIDKLKSHIVVKK